MGNNNHKQSNVSNHTSMQHPAQHSQNENNNNVQIRNGGQNVQQSSIMNEPADPKQIICSFHRDFIPEMDDLYKYFGQFGKITNKLEIEYDNKKVPLAKIKYQNAMSVNKVVNKCNRQQIPSGAQNGTIHIRVYKSMHEYLFNTQRQNMRAVNHRGSHNYNKNKHGRQRGGF